MLESWRDVVGDIYDENTLYEYTKFSKNKNIILKLIREVSKYELLAC